MDIGITTCEDKDNAWEDDSISQGMPATASNQEKLGKSMEQILLYSPQKEPPLPKS